MIVGFLSSSGSSVYSWIVERHFFFNVVPMVTLSFLAVWQTAVPGEIDKLLQESSRRQLDGGLDISVGVVSLVTLTLQ